MKNGPILQQVSATCGGFLPRCGISADLWPQRAHTKIPSLYDDSLNVVVCGKAGAEVEFGNQRAAGGCQCLGAPIPRTRT